MDLLRKPPTDGLGDEVNLDEIALPEPAAEGQAMRTKLARIVSAIKAGINPEWAGAGAKGTADTWRARRAEMMRQWASFQTHMGALDRLVDALPRREQAKVQAAFEAGKPTGIKALDAPEGLPALRRMTDMLTGSLLRRDILRTEQLIENYTAHRWQVDPEALRSLEGIVYGKRPIAGPRTFLKHRVWAKKTDGLQAISDAKARLDAGEGQEGDERLAAMKPLTYNVVREQMGALQEKLKAITAHDIIADEQLTGRAAWVNVGEDPPVDADGSPWVRVDPEGRDPSFVKYGPRNLEAKGQKVFVPGRIVLGNLYAPKQSAAIWHGAASKGIRAVPILGPLYELYMPAANASVQLILGFSGFHYANIGMQGPAASAELALSDALDKNWKGALANVARSSGASVLDAALGKQVLEQYRNPGMHPDLEAGIQAMLAGGYQGTAEAEWFTGDRMQKLKDAFREAWNAENPSGKRLWNGVQIPLDAIYAGIELQMVPLMKWYVPAMKAGATYRAVMDELAKLPPGADRAMVRSRMSAVQKEMDYRYGQVIYSNFFMDNLLKDLAHAIFLAPGWSAGSAMLLARGMTQVPYRLARRILGKMGKGKKLDEEIVGRTTRYMWAELGVLGLAGGLLTWMLTGKPPKGPKDFYFPRDGTTDQDGNPNRFTIPGYPSRDWYDWPTHPVRTLMNKTKPFGAAFFRLLANRDYFGNMYYDPDDPTMAKVRDIAKGAASEVLVPLSARNILEQRRRAPGSSPFRATGGFFGIAPAKKEIQRTSAQNLMAEYLARRGRTAMTPEQQTVSRARADTVAALRRGESMTASSRLESRAEEPALVTRFKQLSLEEAEKVYEAGTPQEQALWEPALATKRTNAGEGGGRVRRRRATRKSR